MVWWRGLEIRRYFKGRYMAELFRKAPRNLVKFRVNLSKSYHVLSSVIVVIVAPICVIAGCSATTWICFIVARAAASELSLFFELLEQFPPVASKPRLHNVVFFQKLQNTCCFQNTRVFTCKLRPKLRLPGPPFATPTRKEGVSATLQSSCVSCVQGKKAFMSWQQIPARSWWWMDMMETQDTMKRIAHTQIYTYFDSCIYNYMHLRGHGCRHVSIKHVYCTETFSLNMRIGAPIVLHIVWFHIHTPLLPCTFAQFGKGEAAPTWCNQVKSQTITSAEAPILECIP